MNRIILSDNHVAALRELVREKLDELTNEKLDELTNPRIQTAVASQHYADLTDRIVEYRALLAAVRKAVLEAVLENA